MRVPTLVMFLISSWHLLAASPEAIYGKNGMIASRSTLASEAGIEVMKGGGNAIDGAVATGFALAVTYPSAGNIGGGGFAVIRLADGTGITLDHRERAPLKAHRDMYLDEQGNEVKGLSRESHLASGVPGSVDGLLKLLETYGTRSRQEVMAPAIRLANKGFRLSHDMARQFDRVVPKMQQYPASLKKFTQDGKTYKEGDLWVQKDLARTLKKIASKGRKGFYQGKVADLIVAEMKRGNGAISLEDLKNYRSIWRDPIRSTYREFEILSMGPPSSGGVLLAQMLNVLEPFKLGEMGWGSAQAIHLMVEAERRAYADRAEYLGDPDFYDVPVAMLTSRKYARERFSDFNKDMASDSEQISAGQWGQESPETTHFSVADGQGNVVALTTTLNSGYGNKIVVAGTGILLNNEMDDFSIKENTSNQYGLIGRKANAIEPGKRMLSSMTPTILTKDGKPVLVTGSPGGSTIITTVLQVIINVVDHGMSIDDAVSLPRFHHQWLPDSILYGRHGFSPDTIKKLEEMGHKGFRVLPYGRGIGDANSILIKDGVMHGMKDPRNEGVAVGF